MCEYDETNILRGINNVKRKDVEEAEFIDVSDRGDYAHMFKGVSGKIYNLTGWTRPNLATLREGDKGMIYYQSAPGYGLHFFDNYTKR